MAKKEYIERPIIPGKEEQYEIIPEIFETIGRGKGKAGDNTKAQKGLKIVFGQEQENEETIQTLQARDNIGTRDDNGNVSYIEDKER